MVRAGRSHSVGRKGRKTIKQSRKLSHQQKWSLLASTPYSEKINKKERLFFRKAKQLSPGVVPHTALCQSILRKTFFFALLINAVRNKKPKQPRNNILSVGQTFCEV